MFATYRQTLPIAAFSLLVTSILIMTVVAPNPLFTLKLLHSPNMDLNLSIGVDNLCRLMGWFICIIASIIFAYAHRYLRADKQRHTFLWQFTLVVASALLLVFAQNLLTTFVAWQFIGVTLYVLLNYYHDNPNANRSAKKKFIINRIGDFSFLCAIIVAIHTHNDTSFETLAHDNNGWLICTLLIISILTKCAQFPFHIWLLDTMEAPTPVSALMHAGIINSGGILLARISPVLIKHISLLTVMLVLSSISILASSYWKQYQGDIKKQLAYSTLGQMGYMLMQCSLAAFPAAILHLITHGFFKASLFLNSGETLVTNIVPTKKNHNYYVLTTISTILLFGIFHLACWALSVQLPILIIFFIVCMITTLSNQIYQLCQSNILRSLLLSGFGLTLALYVAMYKLITQKLALYDFSPQTIPLNIQIAAIVTICTITIAIRYQSKHNHTVFDKTEAFWRHCLLNPIRYIGEYLSTIFEGKILRVTSAVAILCLFIFSILVASQAFSITDSSSNSLILALLMINIISLLAANRSHNLTQLIFFVFLYQLNFITYALLHNDIFITKIAIYHSINTTLVLLVLSRFPNNITKNNVHLLTTTLLMLIGIPGTSSFISEVALLNVLWKSNIAFAMTYLIGLMLLSITIMHTLQVYSFGLQDKNHTPRKRPLLTTILFLVMLITNIVLGISPNLILNHI